MSFQQPQLHNFNFDVNYLWRWSKWIFNNSRKPPSIDGYALQQGCHELHEEDEEEDEEVYRAVEPGKRQEVNIQIMIIGVVNKLIKLLLMLLLIR